LLTPTFDIYHAKFVRPSPDPAYCDSDAASAAALGPSATLLCNQSNLDVFIATVNYRLMSMDYGVRG
jgi:hypothetical protein